MSIKIGNIDISYFKVGGADCSIYLGDVKMYPTTPPTPSSPKYVLTLSDSSTVSAECDSTSSVTSGEVATQYSGSVVSAEIGDCVTSIGTDAFRNCGSLTSVTIPNSVTSIGGSTFRNCGSLTSVIIPSGVTNISSSVFDNCRSLTSVTIPNSVTFIGDEAFYKCSGLTSVTIPSSVTTIGSSAFEKCTSLTSCTIGSGVTTIGGYVFNSCSGLTSVVIYATTPPTLGGYVFNNTNNCPIYVPSESVETYKAAAGWSDYASRIQAIPTPTPTGFTCYEVISDPITAYTATTYDSVYSFAVLKWYMKNNLNAYEEYGVYDVVEDISSATTYEGKLGVVGETEYQYSGGSWTVVGSYVDSSVTYEITNENPSPYVGQELSTTFKIPTADIEALGGYADFGVRDNDDDSLSIRLDTGGMSEYMYQGSGFYNGTVTDDGEYFYLSLPSEAPQSIVIDSIMYWESTPIHIIVGSKQISVEYQEKDIPTAKAYQSVADMEAEVCPTVGVGQFGVVGNNVYQFNDNEEWDTFNNVRFIGRYSGGTTNVLECDSSSAITSADTKPAYISAEITSAVIGDCVTSIGEEAFNNCSNLTSVTIPNSVTSIGDAAFNYCTSLTGIIIPSGVTSINTTAFGSCSSLTSITIPNSVTSIDNSAFRGCSGLTSVTIGSGVTNIAFAAFDECPNLTSVTVNATTPPELGFAVFDTTCPIYVPSASVDAYKSASGWSTYASRIQAIPNL